MTRISEKEAWEAGRQSVLHSEESGGKKLSRKGSGLELSEGDLKDQSVIYAPD